MAAKRRSTFAQIKLTDLSTSDRLFALIFIIASIAFSAIIASRVDGIEWLFISFLIFLVMGAILFIIYKKVTEVSPENYEELQKAIDDSKTQIAQLTEKNGDLEERNGKLEHQIEQLSIVNIEPGKDFKLKVLESSIVIDFESKGFASVREEQKIRCFVRRESMKNILNVDGSINNYKDSLGVVTETKTPSGMMYETKLKTALKEGQVVSRVIEYDIIDSFLADEEFWLLEYINPCDVQSLNILLPKNFNCNWVRLHKMIYFNEVEDLDNYEIKDSPGRKIINVNIENLYKSRYKIIWSWSK